MLSLATTRVANWFAGIPDATARASAGDDHDGHGEGATGGTIVRFSSSTTSVDVTIGEDNPAVRDFLSMLPLTITLEEFAGREKIGYPPRELRHGGSPGSDPENAGASRAPVDAHLERLQAESIARGEPLARPRIGCAWLDSA